MELVSCVSVSRVAMHPADIDVVLVEGSSEWDAIMLSLV